MQSESIIIGIGGAGANFLQYVVSNSEIDIQMTLIDNDEMALKHISNKILPIKITVEDYSQSAYIKAVDDKQAEILAGLNGKKLAIIVSGLGGNTGSGITPYVAELAKEHEICVVVMALTPFSFEGAMRNKISNESLNKISNNSDCIFCIKNDIFRSVAPKGATFSEMMQKPYEYINKYIDIITNIEVEKLREILNKNSLPTHVEVDSETESILKNSISLPD